MFMWQVYQGLVNNADFSLEDNVECLNMLQQFLMKEFSSNCSNALCFKLISGSFKCARVTLVVS